MTLDVVAVLLSHGGPLTAAGLTNGGDLSGDPLSKHWLSICWGQVQGLLGLWRVILTQSRSGVMDLVMTEAILEVAEATMILAITTINLQILDP